MMRLFLYGLLALVILLVLFYFWGSSSRLPIDEKHKILSYSDASIKGSDTFSIMTYNLGYLSGMTNNLPVRPGEELFTDNLAAAQNLMDQLKPDIIGFQEVDYGSKRSYFKNQLQALSKGYHQSAMATNWDKRYVPFPYWPPSVHFGSMHSGQALLSKFPVTQQVVHVLQKPAAAPFYYNAFYLDRLVQQVTIKLPQATLVILNVHLEAFDTETREAQAEDLRNLVDSLVNQGPLIVMGDFNARPGFASERLTEEITMDLFHDHPSLQAAIDHQRYLNQEQQHFTFDTERSYEKLDYIFYNPKYIQAIEAHTVSQAQQISDHLPVMLNFTIKP